MIFYFSARLSRVEDEVESYRAIVQAIYNNEGVLARDWLDDAGTQADSSELNKANQEIDCRQAEAGILASELVVVEASDESSFAVGYETAIAIQNKKPVLALIKEGSLGNSYVSGLDHQLLTCSDYKIDNIEETVAQFIRENAVANKDLRFNFVIDRQIYNHLRWKSFKSGKTKAEIIRDLLAEDISRHSS